MKICVASVSREDTVCDDANSGFRDVFWAQVCGIALFLPISKNEMNPPQRFKCLTICLCLFSFHLRFSFFFSRYNRD